jgi:hypothetical protein
MLKGKLGKTCIGLSVIIVIMTMAVMLLLSSYVYESSLNEYVRTTNQQIADNIISNIGLGTMEYYIQNNTSDDKLIEMQNQFNSLIANDTLRIQIVLKDINGVYFFYDTMQEHQMGEHIMEDEQHFDANITTLSKNTMDLGYAIEINNTVYGWVCITKDTSEINNNIHSYTNSLFSVLLLIGLVQIVVYMGVLRKKVILPLNDLSEALDSYSHNNQDDINIQDFAGRKTNYVSQLDIKTNNEIEAICENLKLLEYDVNNYLDRLNNFKVSEDENKVNLQLLEVIMHIQSMIIKQMYVDFKSFLPIVAYYFKAEKVLFIDGYKEEYNIMIYGNQKYQKYNTKSEEIKCLMGLKEYQSINLKDIPQNVKTLILKEYSKESIGLNLFGDNTKDHNWQVVIVRSNLREGNIEADIMVKAIKSCVQSFFN